MSIESLKTQIAREFGTPAVVIDLDRVEANIARVQQLCDKARVANRPHIKTHKSPVLAKMQVAAGAKGITCQKLGEAEVMVDGGLDDILISYNLLGEEKIGRLGRLLQRAQHRRRRRQPDHHRRPAEGGRDRRAPARRRHRVRHGPQARRRRDGQGGGRAGAAHQGAAPACASTASCSTRPRQSWPQTQRFFDEATKGVRALGLEARIVSTGGTPNLPNMGKLEGATEHRAGTYIFNDRMMLACGAATLDDCALNVYATVVSRAAPERGILDSGSKTLTADTGALDDGFGLILEYPQAKLHAFAEEHGFLDLSRSNARPKVGEVVRVVPNHVCVVVNMVDRMIAVRGDKIVDVLPVAARGRLA